MDSDWKQMAMLLALVLLIPGLLFLFVVVFYVAFVGRAVEPATDAGRVCPKCGQTLLPGQGECPNCAAAASASGDGAA